MWEFTSTGTSIVEDQEGQATVTLTRQGSLAIRPGWTQVKDWGVEEGGKLLYASALDASVSEGK